MLGIGLEIDALVVAGLLSCRAGDFAGVVFADLARCAGSATGSAVLGVRLGVHAHPIAFGGSRLASDLTHTAQANFARRTRRCAVATRERVVGYVAANAIAVDQSKALIAKQLACALFAVLAFCAGFCATATMGAVGLGIHTIAATVGESRLARHLASSCGTDLPRRAGFCASAAVLGIGLQIAALAVTDLLTCGARKFAYAVFAVFAACTGFCTTATMGAFGLCIDTISVTIDESRLTRRLTRSV